MMDVGIVRYLILNAVVLSITACAVAPKEKISSSANASVEIAKQENALREAQYANTDVLARKEFLKSSKHFKQAQELLAKGKKNEKILDELRFSKKYLDEATSLSVKHKNKDSSLFESRQSSIKAGASNSLKLHEEWSDLDQDVADIVDDLDEISSIKIGKLQQQYVDLERKAIIERELGQPIAQLSEAVENGAARNTPVTLRTAKISLENAETMIESSLKEPDGYKKAVLQAIADVDLLTAVMQMQKRIGADTSESVALKFVKKDKTISSLKKNLNFSRGEVEDVRKLLNSTNEELSMSNQNTIAARSSLEMKEAVEKSRQQFSDSEATTYQQDGKLIIRLNAIHFPSGDSELPKMSIKTLKKVSDVAKSLNAKEVKVEGHTDTTGSAGLNQILSEKRANAVAGYFISNGFDDIKVLAEGHGFDDPIASNESRIGRAQNRRVDIIITPTESSSLKR